MNRPIDIIMFGFNDWHQWAAQGFCTRSGAYARELARNDRVRCLLVVSASSSIAMRAVRRVKRDQSKPAPDSGVRGVRGLREAAPGVFVLDHTRVMPREEWFEPFYRTNGLLHDSTLRRRLKRAADVLGMSDHVLWVADPLMAKHMGQSGECLRVFDADDDWSAHPQLKYIRRAVRGGYEVARSKADIIFAVSEALAGDFGKSRDRVYWQPNGVDLRLFDTGTLPPSDIARLPRPVFGYVGVMQQRLDVDAIRLLALQNPGASVVLVGPEVTPGHFEPLRKLNNVHFLGRRDHALIPAYLKSFDVCIMPHVADALTRSMNPLKIYEYLAAGRPVVVTGLAGFEDAADLIVTAPSAGAFAVSAAEIAARGDDGLSGARREYASRHSWSSRVDEMLSIVEAAMPRPAPA